MFQKDGVGREAMNTNFKGDVGRVKVLFTKAAGVLSVKDGTSIVSFVMDEHTSVPWWVHRHWLRKGYFPSKHGIAKVRFSTSDKEYIFPLYFHILKD